MIGETLRIIRIANEDMSQKDVAKGIGVSGTFISYIETGRKTLSLQTLQKFSDFYHIPSSKILEIDEYSDTCDSHPFERTLIKVLEYYISNENNEDKNEKDVPYVKKLDNK